MLEENASVLLRFFDFCIDLAVGACRVRVEMHLTARGGYNDKSDDIRWRSFG